MWGRNTILLLCLLLAAIPASAQSSRDLPAVYDGVGIQEHLGELAPLDLRFANAAGDSVRIADLLVDEQPIVLNFVYHTCPMLCSILLDQLVEGLHGLERIPGDGYQLITVSMASFEDAELAGRQKERYLALLGRPGSEHGWHFLTGSETNVQALADGVGFGFRWVEETQEFAHPAALIFLAGDGTITRYLHGMHYPPEDLEMAIKEASIGSVASVLDRIILYCYRYDPESNSYVAHAENLMKIGGLLSLATLGLLLFLLWRREAVRSAGMTAHA
ncbi:MAG: SCO family protein [Rhodothermales bacterium]|nr:SCO family protein [Rhodothermales bacterium]